MLEDANPLLRNNGTLVTHDGQLIASYDLENQTIIDARLKPLLQHPRVLNASLAQFELNYAENLDIHIINGMGVALGDSVIGISALNIIQQFNPNVRFTLYRPSRTPVYVQELYHLASTVGLIKIINLPYYFKDLPLDGTYIDLGNQFFWPQFHKMPMIDFFLWALGINPDAISSQAKHNKWLQQLLLPDLPEQWQGKPYILFCPVASTPIRSIPLAMRYRFIERLWQKYKLPILGFEDYKHRYYVNVSALTANPGNTVSFINWIKHAKHLVCVDSAAVHLAAGFGVPCSAIFATILPQLRIRDYPYCRAITLNLPQFNNLHASDNPHDLHMLAAAYQNFDYQLL